MNDRGYSYEEILQVHQRSATKAFTGTGAPVQYGRTLDTAWECSFGKLSAESKTLLKILTFDLDLISESILNRRLGIADTAMEILFDDFDFGVGVIDLTRAASLVSRLSTHRAISIHRLVLFIVFSRLTTDKTSTFLNYAIRMLSSSFPNTWNERVRKLGHGRASCDKYSKILSHVGWLMALTRANLLIVISPELLAELVFRAGSLRLARATANYAQAYHLLGHIALDLAQPSAARSVYRQAFRVREALEGPHSPSVADIYGDIACSYTEQGNVADALKYIHVFRNS
ncbi:hypothetical protein DIZ76_016899 [Coccidioides immitis]|nr:hypothetical protein DIZ76_016899 [Coccidioides immitis]